MWFPYLVAAVFLLVTLGPGAAQVPTCYDTCLSDFQALLESGCTMPAVYSAFPRLQSHFNFVSQQLPTINAAVPSTTCCLTGNSCPAHYGFDLTCNWLNDHLYIHTVPQVSPYYHCAACSKMSCGYAIGLEWATILTPTRECHNNLHTSDFSCSWNIDLTRICRHRCENVPPPPPANCTGCPCPTCPPVTTPANTTYNITCPTCPICSNITIACPTYTTPPPCQTCPPVTAPANTTYNMTCPACANVTTACPTFTTPPPCPTCPPIPEPIPINCTQQCPSTTNTSTASPFITTPTCPPHPTMAPVNCSSACPPPPATCPPDRLPRYEYCRTHGYSSCESTWQAAPSDFDLCFDISNYTMRYVYDHRLFPYEPLINYYYCNYQGGCTFYPTLATYKDMAVFCPAVSTMASNLGCTSECAIYDSYANQMTVSITCPAPQSDAICFDTYCQYPLAPTCGHPRLTSTYRSCEIGPISQCGGETDAMLPNYYCAQLGNYIVDLVNAGNYTNVSIAVNPTYGYCFQEGCEIAFGPFDDNVVAEEFCTQGGILSTALTSLGTCNIQSCGYDTSADKLYSVAEVVCRGQLVTTDVCQQAFCDPRTSACTNDTINDYVACATGHALYSEDDQFCVLYAGAIADFVFSAGLYPYRPLVTTFTGHALDTYCSMQLLMQSTDDAAAFCDLVVTPLSIHVHSYPFSCTAAENTVVLRYLSSTIGTPLDLCATAMCTPNTTLADTANDACASPAYYLACLGDHAVNCFYNNTQAHDDMCYHLGLYIASQMSSPNLTYVPAVSTNGTTCANEVNVPYCQLAFLAEHPSEAVEIQAIMSSTETIAAQIGCNAEVPYTTENPVYAAVSCSSAITEYCGAIYCS